MIKDDAYAVSKKFDLPGHAVSSVYEMVACFTSYFLYDVKIWFLRASHNVYCLMLYPNKQIRLVTSWYCYLVLILRLFPVKVLNTSKGYIIVELFKDGSPETVDKFIDLW